MEDTLGQIIPRKLGGDESLHEAGRTLGLSALLELAPAEASYAELAEAVEDAGRAG